jgi:thioredoxin-dependent peroxiredoxin
MTRTLALLMGVSAMMLGTVSKAEKSQSAGIGEVAPLFKAVTQDGKTFDLSSRKGQGWTVLYFYPKAGTPGCTKQACAFRDAIQGIRQLGAEVFGISGDTVEQQHAFHEKYQLKFDLIADPDASIIQAYGAKMPLVNIAKRWTFILDPELKIRWVERDVDPMLDAKTVAAKTRELQALK